MTGNRLRYCDYDFSKFWFTWPLDLQSTSRYIFNVICIKTRKKVEYNRPDRIIIINHKHFLAYFKLHYMESGRIMPILVVEHYLWVLIACSKFRYRKCNLKWILMTNIVFKFGSHQSYLSSCASKRQTAIAWSKQDLSRTQNIFRRLYRHIQTII